jgi:hypothetical protein
MTNNLLIFLWGILAGYFIATINMAFVLVNKGYRSVNEIPEKEFLDEA